MSIIIIIIIVMQKFPINNNFMNEIEAGLIKSILLHYDHSDKNQHMSVRGIV